MERANTVKRHPIRHGLGWREWLSTAPIIALFGFGTFLVFQEHRLARQNALESLNTAGEDLIHYLEKNISIVRWIQEPNEYNDLFRYFLSEETYNIKVGPNGEYLTVTSPAQPPIPTPTLLPWDLLTESETLLWHEATQTTDHAQRLSLIESFINTHPPQPFAALMRLSRVNSLLDSKSVDTGLAEIQKIRSDLPDNVYSEAGFPLSVLLDFQELRAISALIASGKDPDAAFARFYSRTLVNPNLWTRQMLTHHLPAFDDESKSHLLAQKLFEELDRRDEAQTIHASLLETEWQRLSNEAVATPHWIKHRFTDLLVCRFTNEGSDHEFIAATAESLRYDCEVVLNQWQQKTPQANQFTISVSLGDKRIVPSDHPLPLDAAINDQPEQLKSSQRSEPIPWLQANVALADQNAFFAQSRYRTRSLLALVTLASITGLVGWFAQRTAYNRQVALSQMKSNFVASVSHELRAPIASIRLMIENLQIEKPSNQNQRSDYLKWIGLECGRLTGLVENVLQFARLETHKANYTFEPVDINRLFQETIRLMEPIAIHANVQLEIDSSSLAPDQLNPALEGNWDGQAVHQAIVNLIDNAIKHSPSDGLVSVKLDSLEDQATVAFSITDQGPGIPQADRGRIFSPFERLGSEATRRTKGVGIGLNLVQHTAHAHGGTVAVKDAEGGGSCFVLRLPLNQNPT